MPDTMHESTLVGLRVDGAVDHPECAALRRFLEPLVGRRVEWRSDHRSDGLSQVAIGPAGRDEMAVVAGAIEDWVIANNTAGGRQIVYVDAGHVRVLFDFGGGRPPGSRRAVLVRMTRHRSPVVALYAKLLLAGG